MPRDVNGNTQPLPGTIVSSGDTILPSQHNPAMQDLYAMMTQSLSRDGQGGMRQPLDMNNFPIRNVGSATQANDAISLSQFQAGMPVGAVVDYVGDNAPTGWMLCFGQAISRSAYPEAFTACGTKFGTGDGSTTFNLPDYRGRVGVGKDDMGGADSNRLSFFGALRNLIGGIFGSASHVLATGQMPSHNHGGATSGGGGHTNTTQFRRYQQASTSNAGGYIGEGTGFPINSEIGGYHEHTIPSQGNNEAHTNAQPSIIINKIIKVTY